MNSRIHYRFIKVIIVTKVKSHKINVNLVTTKILVKGEDASAEKIKNQKCEIKNCHVKSKSRGSLWLFTPFYNIKYKK